MKNNKLRYLKWATVGVPPLLAWLYETLRHSILQDELGGWTGNLLAAVLILACSFMFAQIVFGVIDRLYQRQVDQNRQLKQLNRQVKELAIVEERGRLSREMHDGLAQLLAYALMKIDLIETLLRKGCLLEAEHELQLVREACNNGYEDVREAITGLRPEFFDGRDFLTMLSDLLEQFGDNNQLATDLQLNRIERTNAQLISQLFPPATCVQLLRVVQEALTNVRKHAQASSVKILVELDNNHNLWHTESSAAAIASVDNLFWSDTSLDSVRVVIQDDGRGFELNKINQPRDHFGCTIMRERIESLGGQLQLSSEPGQGTRVELRLPVKLSASPAIKLNYAIEPSLN